MNRPHHTRRDFVRGTAYGALGLTLGMSASGTRAQPGPEAGRARVVLVRRRDALSDDPVRSAAVVREMLEEACGALSSDGRSSREWWSGAFAPGEKVAIKANLMMSNTRAEVLAAIHDCLVEYAGTESGSIAAWDRRSVGFGREALAGPKSAWGQTPEMGYNEDSVSLLAADWADALINVPSLKCHWLSGVAIALKNWCGAVTNISVGDPEDAAFRFHGDSCANLGMFQALPAFGGKCRLVVVDALEAYYERGPQTDPEYFHPYGGLIVGADAVAVDAIGAMLLQAIRDEVAGEPSPISPPPKHIAVAESKYGLGVSDPGRIDLVRLGDEDGMLV